MGIEMTTDGTRNVSRATFKSPAVPVDQGARSVRPHTNTARHHGEAEHPLSTTWRQSEPCFGCSAYRLRVDPSSRLLVPPLTRRISFLDDDATDDER
jgi:hypothetical protein